MLIAIMSVCFLLPSHRVSLSASASLLSTFLPLSLPPFFFSFSNFPNHFKITNAHTPNTHTYTHIRTHPILPLSSPSLLLSVFTKYSINVHLIVAYNHNYGHSSTYFLCLSPFRMAVPPNNRRYTKTTRSRHHSADLNYGSDTSSLMTRERDSSGKEEVPKRETIIKGFKGGRQRHPTCPQQAAII